MDVRAVHPFPERGNPVSKITNPSYRFAFRATNLAALLLASAAACNGGNGGGGGAQPIKGMQATIGPQGGGIAGAQGSAPQGGEMGVPAGAPPRDPNILIKAASRPAQVPARIA